MIPIALAERVRELLHRRARFKLELDAYDGKWQHWRITENGKLLDEGAKEVHNGADLEPTPEV